MLVWSSKCNKSLIANFSKWHEYVKRTQLNTFFFLDNQDSGKSFLAASSSSEVKLYNAEIVLLFLRNHRCWFEHLRAEERKK